MQERARLAGGSVRFHASGRVALVYAAGFRSRPKAWQWEKTIRLMLLDDHALVRTGYRRLFDAERDMGWSAEAAGADEACACLRACDIDVAVVDLSLKGASGIEAIRRLLQRNRGIRILVLSMYDEPWYVRQAIRAGALGYMTKDAGRTN